MRTDTSEQCLPRNFELEQKHALAWTAKRLPYRMCDHLDYQANMDTY